MKNQLLIALCILGFLHAGNSQNDLQWLVKEGKGKSGVTGNPATANTFSNALGGSIILQNIVHPNLNCNGSARNDIFVIYTDRTYYNSRNSNPSFFYNAAHLTDVNHNFNAPQGKSISELYLSNIYEGDDPPDAVRALSGSSGSNQTYQLGVSTTPAIDANHDVVPNKDLTLIINTTGLGSVGFSLKYRCWDSNLSNSYPGTFTVINSFGNTVSNIGGGFSFNSGAYPEYIYLTVRPDPNVYIGYSPSDNKDAIFDLVNNQGVIMGSKSENILSSHDPNFVEVKSICKSDNYYFVTYHIEFRNSSFTPANNLEIEVNLPTEWKASCIGSDVWFAGGVEVDGKYHFTDGSKINFVFDRSATLQQCDATKDPSLEKCRGYIEFCVAIDGSQFPSNTSIHNIPLGLNNTTVTFDSKAYPINNFIDAPGLKKINDWYRKMNEEVKCGCSCDKTTGGGIIKVGIALLIVLLGIFLLIVIRKVFIPRKRGNPPPGI